MKSSQTKTCNVPCMLYIRVCTWFSFFIFLMTTASRGFGNGRELYNGWATSQHSGNNLPVANTVSTQCLVLVRHRSAFSHCAIYRSVCWSVLRSLCNYYSNHTFFLHLCQTLHVNVDFNRNGLCIHCCSDTGCCGI